MRVPPAIRLTREARLDLEKLSRRAHPNLIRGVAADWPAGE
jgi:hypothetical protein